MRMQLAKIGTDHVCVNKLKDRGFVRNHGSIPLHPKVPCPTANRILKNLFMKRFSLKSGHGNPLTMGQVPD